MEIIKGIDIVDLSLYIKKQKILVFGDVHIGYEESLNKQGMLIPRFHFQDLMQKIENIFKKVNPKTVIINGDLKHEFGTISDTEWKQTMKFLEFLTEKATVVLLKGNHDKILRPIASKKNLEITDFYSIDDIYICHGDKIPESLEFSKSKTVIVGHEHPAITLREEPRVEKYKCFIKGKYRSKTLIVMPSLNLVTEGTDLLNEKLLSPFLKQNLGNFDVFVVENKVYNFGKLSKLRKLQL
jgi:uncharacterized protein